MTRHFWWSWSTGWHWQKWGVVVVQPFWSLAFWLQKTAACWAGREERGLPTAYIPKGIPLQPVSLYSLRKQKSRSLCILLAVHNLFYASYVLIIVSEGVRHERWCWKETFTPGWQRITPVFQQRGDVADELNIERIGEDILKTPIIKQTLNEWQKNKSCFCKSKFSFGVDKSTISNLLNAQAQVVDAIRLINLAVRPADLLDETAQTVTEFCRAAL